MFILPLKKLHRTCLTKRRKEFHCDISQDYKSPESRFQPQFDFFKISKDLKHKISSKESLTERSTWTAQGLDSALTAGACAPSSSKCRFRRALMARCIALLPISCEFLQSKLIQEPKVWEIEEVRKSRSNDSKRPKKKEDKNPHLWSILRSLNRAGVQKEMGTREEGKMIKVAWVEGSEPVDTLCIYICRARTLGSVGEGAGLKRQDIFQ